MQVGDMIEHTFRYVVSANNVLQEKEILLIEADEGQLVVVRPVNSNTKRIYGKNGSFKLPKEYLLKNARIINGTSKV
jgi:hypothetical protein